MAPRKRKAEEQPAETAARKPPELPPTKKKRISKPTPRPKPLITPSSPLRPLPPPNLRDLLARPVFKPVEGLTFERRLSLDLLSSSFFNIF